MGRSRATGSPLPGVNRAIARQGGHDKVVGTHHIPNIKIFWRIRDILLRSAASSTISTETGNRGIFLHNGNSTPLICYHQSRHKLCDEKASHHLINYLSFLKGPFSKVEGEHEKKLNRNEMYFPDFFGDFCSFSSRETEIQKD